MKKNKRSWQNLNKNYFVLRSECEDTMLIFGIILKNLSFNNCYIFSTC